METIIAIYEHGVLRPLTPLQLPEHSRVELQVVEPASGVAERDYSFIGIFNSGKPDLAESVEDILDQTTHDKHEGWDLTQ
jgi:predicted DNA-binding antitoxin AbrB/MazE fold protein